MSKPLSPLVLLPVALVCGVGGALIGTSFQRPAAAEERPGASAPAPDAPRLAQLEARVEELARALERATAQEPARVAVGDDALAEAVARWMERNAPLAASAEKPAAADALASAREREQKLSDALAALLAPGLGEAERQKIWSDMVKAGLVDALVAEFEKRAELDPNDPDAQVELGSAYLQKLFTVGSGPEQGTWANKADKAFDAALALDSNHWDARFSKAVSLSFWPPVFGKQKDAIRNFETLIEQQSSSSSKDPRFAQTHLLLGNLYQQSGNAAKANETWAAGLALYPDSAALKEKLGQ